MTEVVVENKEPVEPKKVGIYSIVLPVDPQICQDAIRLASDKTKPIEEISTIAGQNPAIVLELLKITNQLHVAGDKARIVSTKGAIIRLGNAECIKLFKRLLERPTPTDVDEITELKKIRYRALRIAIVSQLLSEALVRTYSDDCYSAGLMVPIAELIGLLHWKDGYVAVAKNNNSRNNILLGLIKEFKFDAEKYRENYLRKNGLPETLNAIICHDGTTPPKDRILLPIIVNAAVECVDAFDLDKWERYAPGKQLPPKSPVRALPLQSNQYSKIYERASELFFSMKKRWSNENSIEVPPAEIKNAIESPIEAESLTMETVNPGVSVDAHALEDEIHSLLNMFHQPATPVVATPAAPLPEAKKEEIPPAVERPSYTPSVTRSGVFPRTNKALHAASESLAAAKSSEEAISAILEMLVSKGSFKRTALLVVSPNKDTATVVSARGSDLQRGQTLIIEDSISPLNQAFSRVQSFGKKQSELSPFGSKSFALAPIPVNHPTPVALYADVGDSPITFESRRIFREVIDLLSKKLPTLPGGIPVQIAK